MKGTCQEIWAYRELLLFFTEDEEKTQYKQIGSGFAWVIIVPLFTMIILSLIFGGFAKILSNGIAISQVDFYIAFPVLIEMIIYYRLVQIQKMPLLPEFLLFGTTASSAGVRISGLFHFRKREQCFMDLV